jgi:hypothetical protein
MSMPEYSGTATRKSSLDDCTKTPEKLQTSKLQTSEKLQASKLPELRAIGGKPLAAITTVVRRF